MIHRHSSLKNLKCWKLNKNLLLSASLSTLLLTACDNGSGLTHVNDVFSKSWEQIARKDPDYIVNDISHMKKQEEDLRTASQPEMQAIPVEDVSVEPMQITKADVPPMPEEVPPIERTSVRNPNLLTYNPKNIFGKPVGSPEERIDRLERAVQDMRNDFNLVEPSIRRLMALEGEMQMLVAELEKLNISNSLAIQEKKSNKPPSNTTAKKSNTQSSTASKSSFVKKSAPPVGSQPSIFDLRVGEHSDKTRIVMDVNTKTDFSVDIDNGERIMVVDLPNSSWDARTSQTFAKSPYISSYKVESTDTGNIVIFQLKRDVKIGYKADLKGFEGSSRRLVIDVTG
jgi:hypothetical protein